MGAVEESATSLIARSGGKIIGHIGICPRQFIVTGNGSAPVSTMHAIDWLGSAEHAGAGTFLMLQAFGSCKTQYALGGSDHAQAVFPRLGFDQKPSLPVYRKVLAPFHRLRTTDQSWIRKLGGTAKDILTVWRSRTRPTSETVELRQVSAFTADIDSLLQQSTMKLVTCQRDHLLLNYFLRYPLPGFSGWTIHSSGKLIGYALLKVTPYGRIQQGRIVDCWLDTEEFSYWQSAVAALNHQLRAASVDTVTCYATHPSLLTALQLNGFTPWGEKNVYIRDKQHSLPSELQLGLSMLEADHAIF